MITETREGATPQSIDLRIRILRPFANTGDQEIDELHMRPSPQHARARRLAELRMPETEG